MTHHAPIPPKRPGDPDGFRWHLKRQTQDAHDRLDNLIATCDLATAAGLTAFAIGHLQAFRALAAHNRHPHLLPMISALAADISVLRPGPPMPAIAAPGPLSPLALRYIIAGSRLGTEVLRRDWQTATDPMVKAASHYFALSSDKAAWPAVCAELDRVKTDSPDAATILRDTRRIYDLFAMTCRAAMTA